MTWTLKSFALLLLIFLGWYLAADRMTPFSGNARVRAIVTPIVPQVSGTITEVSAQNGETVEAGVILAQIDKRPFDIEVSRAKAALEAATQDVGASSATVQGSQARLTRAQADLETTRQQADRTFELERKGLVSVARADDMRGALSESEAEVEKAVADLERARQQLGATGEDNPRVRSALADLAQAELNLEWTTLRAPTRGGVSGLSIGAGSFASSGKELMTFIDSTDIWIEAYLSENNLGNLDVGDPVDIVLDIHPRRVISGVVASFSGAASAGAETRAGALSSVPRASGWLREPQLFPVRIVMPDFTEGNAEDDVRFQVNGQADIVIYATDLAPMNAIGRAYIRAISWLTYAY